MIPGPTPIRFYKQGAAFSAPGKGRLMGHHPRLFIVEVWHSDAGVRASVAGVDGEPARCFDDAAMLGAFMLHARKPAAGGSLPLSSRESEVALLFGAGSSHKRIALQLGLAPATVRNHLSACYRKLGVDNRAALLRALGRPSAAAVDAATPACAAEL